MRKFWLTFLAIIASVNTFAIAPENLRATLDKALNSNQLNSEQENIVSNLSSFFFYAEPNQVRIILKNSDRVAERYKPLLDSNDGELLFDIGVSLVFMTEKLSKYGFITSVLTTVFDTNNIGLEPYDIIRMVATNEAFQNDNITDKDYEDALYFFLAHMNPNEFSSRMQNEPQFKKGMAKLILKVKHNGGL